MDKKEILRQSIISAVNEYLENEEAYSDDVQLEINTANLQADLADPEQDLPEYDYYPVMDLVCTASDDSGRWIVDEEAVDSVVSDYLTA